MRAAMDFQFLEEEDGGGAIGEGGLLSVRVRSPF